MKRIVLIVPRVLGTRAGTSRSSTEVSRENLLKVLGKSDDYHEDYCFDLRKIEIVSIDDYEQIPKNITFH